MWSVSPLIAGQYAAYEPIDSRLFAEDYVGTLTWRGLSAYRLVIMDIHVEVAVGLAFMPAIRCNEDAGNNYRLTTASLTSSPAYAETALQAYYQIGSMMGSTESAHMRAMIAIQPAAANRHLIRSKSSTNGSGAGDSHLHAGYWEGAAAIDRLSIIPAVINGGWGAGSVIALYGMR